MRFCKECGFHSFSQFKLAFTDQLYHEREVIQSNVELYEHPKYYCTIIENTIRRTASVLSEEKLNTALNLRIMIYCFIQTPEKLEMVWSMLHPGSTCFFLIDIIKTTIHVVFFFIRWIYIFCFFFSTLR